MANRPTSMSFTWSISTLQIVGSSVAEAPFGAVLMDGIGTAAVTADDGTIGEKPEKAEAFGAPGLVFRPREPEDLTGADGQTYKKVGAEALGVRMGDELIPFTWRDLRFNKVYPAPKPGTVALVGYGGAFLSFDDTAGKDSLVTLYVPYAGGTKCHSIVLDPSAEVIGIVHGDGMTIGMSADGGIVARADGSTTWTLKPGLFQVIASKIILQGNVVAGANPAATQPAAVIIGGAPSISPSVFLSGV